MHCLFHRIFIILDKIYPYFIFIWVWKNLCWSNQTSITEFIIAFFSQKLMVQLIRRYLHCKSMQVRSPLFPNLTDEFKEQLKEEITLELRKSLKLQNRRYTRRPTTRRVAPTCMRQAASHDTRPDLENNTQPTKICRLS